MDTDITLLGDGNLWDELHIALKGGAALADLGFIGADKGCPKMVLPYKKPKGKELSGLQQQINKAHTPYG
ncbi:MAG: hypothetical protein AAF632_11710 [Bacteroidota bacterium]